MAKKSSALDKAIKKRGSASRGMKFQSPKEETGYLIEQVRALAWEGKHARAIELATEALSHSKIKPAEQMNLLDLRAESYLVQLKYDLAEKDVMEMERLAKAENKPALKAQALVRKANLRAWQDRVEDTQRTAKSALKFARLSKQKYLEAESLFWLAWYGPNDICLRLAQQAADLYLSLDLPSRAGRVLNMATSRYINLGKYEEARRLIYSALKYC
ncbi:MAG: hypothetical protein ACM3PS_17600 [Syntrophothermus sp.]